MLATVLDFPGWPQLPGLSEEGFDRRRSLGICTDIQRLVPFIPEGNREAVRLSGEAKDSEEPSTFLNGMPVPASARCSLYFRRKTMSNASVPIRNCLRRDGFFPVREAGRCNPIGVPT